MRNGKVTRRPLPSQRTRTTRRAKGLKTAMTQIFADRVMESSPPSSLKRCGSCWNEKPPEMFAANRRTCKECVRAAGREYQKKHGDRIRASRRKIYRANAATQILQGHCRRYGISREEYLSLMAVRECGICRATSRRLCIDHDHSTGKVRGRICHQCNSGLGYFGDSAERMLRAAQYIREHA